MEIGHKKGEENVMAHHLSRLSDAKSEELPFDNSLPNDRLIAFLRVEAS